MLIQIAQNHNNVDSALAALNELKNEGDIAEARIGTLSLEVARQARQKLERIEAHRT
jgi:putative ubiquitin-RnfH superfamily antitoxin RatB of RatAB toxin-antitoxin module